MKNIYILTCYDTKINGFTATYYYSNPKSAKESFVNLTNHIIKKHELVNPKIEAWAFNTGGINKTDVIADRFNITLVKYSVNKDTSTFISACLV
jgi:hypothetical protein|tara:strand:- start:729 stop:1010 length:282 start_codon:yes stop_codon:yes gene_type:complete